MREPAQQAWPWFQLEGGVSECGGGGRGEWGGGNKEVHREDDVGRGTLEAKAKDGAGENEDGGGGKEP